MTFTIPTATDITVQFLAPDFETHLITDDDPCPRPVCLVVGSAVGCDLYPTAECAEEFRRCLESGALLVGVNFAYDACVAGEHLGLRELVDETYHEGRILDLAVWDRCAQIEGRTGIKKPSMQALCEHYGVACPDKEGDARVTFGQYEGLSLAEYSAEHIGYLAGDGQAGYKLATRLYAKYPELIAPAIVLSRKQYWLQRGSNRGLTTHPGRVVYLEETTRARHDEIKSLAMAPVPLPSETIGEPVIRANGTCNKKRLKAWVEFAYQGNPPMTNSRKRDKETAKKRAQHEMFGTPFKEPKTFVPQVRTDKGTLLESGDPFLDLLSEYGELGAVLNKDLEYLRRPVLRTRWSIAETTRSNSSKPNLTNLRRAAGIREIIVPRDGYAFLAWDHVGLELVCAAQGAVDYLGAWDMADKINSGVDLHVLVGADVAELDYDTLLALIAIDATDAHGKPYKEFRQLGKVPNFGCLGGMTYAPTLALYARGQGFHMTDAEAARVLLAWERRNPDGKALQDYVKWRLPKWGHGFEVPIPGSGLTRRGAPFCAAANTLFQGRGAWLEANVGWALYRATQDPSSDLWGSHLVHYVHDEFICEVPLDRVSEAGQAGLKIMRESAQPFVKDVKIDAECTAMNTWSKGAKSHWHDGKLSIWEYQQVA